MFPLPDGTATECDPEGENPCCDGKYYGMCGNTTEHCSCYRCKRYVKKWRDDGKCGNAFGHNLPNGKPAECNPDGKNPCCSDERWGECGNTTKHCSCSGCKDYKFAKMWRETGGRLKWRKDGKCGENYLLPNGKVAECNPDGENPCCNQYGVCGNTTEHCSCSECIHYFNKWRKDGKCGKTNLLPDGKAAECDPDGENPCCSDRTDGECGNTTKHCSCYNCVNFKSMNKWRNDRKCGKNYLLPNGTAAECDPDGEKPCCSGEWDGECGNTTDHCSCIGCKDFKFEKEWGELGGIQMWRNDRRCGSDYPLPNGTAAECNPDGEDPCCNGQTGECGSTTEHCSCSECKDFKFEKDWRESDGKLKWSYNGKCGKFYPLPNGEAAECNPVGEDPCCSDELWGECGNTAEHCSCHGCIDYKFAKEWEDSAGKLKWRNDGKCGKYYPLPNGEAAECDPMGENPCCNYWEGECGNTTEHCSCYGCKHFVVVVNNWRTDKKCGSAYPLSDGRAAECDPDGENPCCNDRTDGKCGNTTQHCSCFNCVDFRSANKWRNDGKCGNKHLLPNGEAAECDPDGETPCCNDDQDGECGNTAEHCYCTYCIDYKFVKEWRGSDRTIKWRNDGKCGLQLPDGETVECDPDGNNPCCNDLYGECGNTSEHCSCVGCRDYKFEKEWMELGGKQLWRNDGKCGESYPLPDGAAAECNPVGANPCCSESGDCGNTTEHCSCIGCRDYKFEKEWWKLAGKQLWRNDGKCGPDYPLPNGEAAECNPDGENPCCSASHYWWEEDCGNTAEQCSCIGCRDYKFEKEWWELGGKQLWRNDGKCGKYYPLPNGEAAECDPMGENPCCNYWDWNGECGNTTEHCSCYGCIRFVVVNNWRTDKKCGSAYPLSDGRAAECDPDGENPCCNDRTDGECGNTTQHCSCFNCVDFRSANKWRNDGKCGNKHLLPNGAAAECDPDGENPCCNDRTDGKCGNTTQHCSCFNCVDFRSANKWRNDGRCGNKHLLPNGAAAECDPDGENPCCDGQHGECGKTTRHCNCSTCINFRLLKEWTKLGKEMWRDDGKCGSNYPLPNGTAAECDPDGDKPCCSDEWGGECGNTTTYCHCSTCIDYKFVKQWRGSNGTLKWRKDGFCGMQLPDGEKVECDPDGENPCCGFTFKNLFNTCGNSDDHCFCNDCINYKLVKNIKKSGKNCTITRWRSGFLKHACFHEKEKQFYFKCLYSDVNYSVGQDPDFDVLKLVSEKCENDPYVYQACGFNTKITNKNVLCGGYICEHKTWWWSRYANIFVDCTSYDCKDDSKDCMISQNETELLKCDDKCDMRHCEDESDCNGYKYGMNCDWIKGNYLPAVGVCDKTVRCYDESNRKDCYITNSTVSTCIHYSGILVPILNYTRCSVLDYKSNSNGYPYCWHHLDQTNCSDVERVGGYCEVNGYMSSVSKYVVCHDFDPNRNISLKICDNNLQKNCVSPSDNDCRIHKHKMCDGVKDCPDGSDEIHEMCKTMTGAQSFVCTRAFNTKNKNIPISLSWIIDGTTDCMNGEDEDLNKWKLCKGDIKQVLLSNEECQDFFKCPCGEQSGVPFDRLCDGVESCGGGGENSVCRIARDFPVLDRVAQYDSAVRNVCNSANCEMREFRRDTGDIFGVNVKAELLVPTLKTSCKNLFGEHYLFLSCMDLCLETEITCPLDNVDNKLVYDSCPAQFQNRALTIVDNSYLTFVLENDNGDYHQELFQCANKKCVEYKQVCDLVDDCGDMSDEIHCKNHMICEDTLNSSKHQFISLSQKCDGIYDCFDLSDECNKDCGREILGNWVLKITCSFMGLLAMLFNFYTMANGFASLKDCETANMLTSKALMSLIGSGDFLIGVYLVILSVYDSIVFKKEYCRHQDEWLTGTACLYRNSVGCCKDVLGLRVNE